MRTIKFDSGLYKSNPQNGYQLTQKAYSGLTEGTACQGGEVVPTPLADYVIDEKSKGVNLFRTKKQDL